MAVQCSALPVDHENTSHKGHMRAIHDGALEVLDWFLVGLMVLCDPSIVSNRLLELVVSVASLFVSWLADDFQKIY